MVWWHTKNSPIFFFVNSLTRDRKVISVSSLIVIITTMEHGLSWQTTSLMHLLGL